MKFPIRVINFLLVGFNVGDIFVSIVFFPHGFLNTSTERVSGYNCDYFKAGKRNFSTNFNLRKNYFSWQLTVVPRLDENRSFPVINLFRNSVFCIMLRDEHFSHHQ